MVSNFCNFSENRSFSVQIKVAWKQLVTESFFIVKDNFQYISGRHLTYFHPPVFLQIDVTALQTQRGLGIFGQKPAPSNSPAQRFLWKNRMSEALLKWGNDIVQMRGMAHSICLIKLSIYETYRGQTTYPRSRCF